MAQIFGGIADVVNALAPGKTKKNYLSDALQGQIDSQTATLGDYRKGQTEDLNRILAGVAGAQPMLATMGVEDISTLGQIINQAKNTTAADLAQQMGNYKTAALDKVAANLASLGKAQDNRLLAATGHGGGGGSTFQTNSILDRVTRNLAPAYASILGNLEQGAGSLISGDALRAGTAANLIGERANIPLRGVYADMLAGNIRSQNMADQIAALAGLGGVYNQNYLGSTYTPSKIGGVASGLAKTGDALVDTAEAGADRVAGIISGFAGGGGFNATGGGGARAGGITGSPPANFGPSGFGGYGLSYSGGPMTGGFGPANYYPGSFGYTLPTGGSNGIMNSGISGGSLLKGFF